MLKRIRSLLRVQSGAEVVRFALVGASGVVVNNVILYLLHGLAGWPLIVSSLLAVEVAIVNNFLWNDRWTFSDRSKTEHRFLKFNLFSLGGLAVNTVVLVLLVSITGMHYLVANLIAIGVATTWNFAANARWTWRRLDGAGSTENVVWATGEVVTDDLVIVPTYNEAENIEKLVERVLGEGPFGILIVDDGSPDGTGEIADRLARENQARLCVIHRTSKDGLGAAYRAGFAHALESGAHRIYQMDADLSHDPSVLSGMRSALLNDIDLVIGSRYVDGGALTGWPWWRKVLSRGGSIYAGIILRLTERDLTGGFKGWRKEALASIRSAETRSNGYAFQIETTYRAHLAGARVVEVPITFADREYGISKMGWPIIFEAVRVVPGLRLKRPVLEWIAPALRTGAAGGRVR